MRNPWLKPVACGWLLLLPPDTSKQLRLPEGASGWVQEVYARVDADLRAPLSQWRQARAFDSAEACEAWKAQLIESRPLQPPDPPKAPKGLRQYLDDELAAMDGSPEPTPTAEITKWKADFAWWDKRYSAAVTWDHAEKERLEAGRCLPATVVR
jgi:hypothetical protein